MRRRGPRMDVPAVTRMLEPESGSAQPKGTVWCGATHTSKRPRSAGPSTSKSISACFTVTCTSASLRSARAVCVSSAACHTMATTEQYSLGSAALTSTWTTKGGSQVEAPRRGRCSTDRPSSLRSNEPMLHSDECARICTEVPKVTLDLCQLSDWYGATSKISRVPRCTTMMGSSKQLTMQ